MTERETCDRAFLCSEPGLSFWTERGELVPTLCMKIKDHTGPHEHKSGGFLAQLDRDIAAQILAGPEGNAT